MLKSESKWSRPIRAAGSRKEVEPIHDSCCSCSVQWNDFNFLIIQHARFFTQTTFYWTVQADICWNNHRWKVSDRKCLLLCVFVQHQTETVCGSSTSETSTPSTEEVDGLVLLNGLKTNSNGCVSYLPSYNVLVSLANPKNLFGHFHWKS